jgi:nitrogen fixation NifU-like protein
MMSQQEQIENILDHYEYPRHHGCLEPADLVGEGHNPGCGDVVRVYVRLGPGDTIAAIAFEGRGCTISQAGASMFAEQALGATLASILAQDGEALAGLMGADVLASRHKCATLAQAALQSAVEARRGREQESTVNGSDKPSNRPGR